MGTFTPQTLLFSYTHSALEMIIKKKLEQSLSLFLSCPLKYPILSNPGNSHPYLASVAAAVSARKSSKHDN